MRSEEQIMEDYKKFRGKCKEYVDALIAEDPTLTAVRGHYVCPVWLSVEPHWWAVNEKDGTIVDPTCAQFPSNGNGAYIPFDGICDCAECGVQFEEGAVGSQYESNYAFCSTKCAMRFVGLGEYVND